MMYEVIVANYIDDTTKSKMVLSYEPLNKNSFALPSVLGIDEEWEYIHEVKIADVYINAYNEDEWRKLEEIRGKLEGIWSKLEEIKNNIIKN